MTPAERKRRQRTSGRATTERVNAAIITAFKRGLADLVEHARPATLLTVYHEVVRRFPGEDAERIDAQLFGAAGARPRVPPAALARGEEFTLVGFGSFGVTERAARAGRNPKTGEPIHIPTSKAPTFKSGRKLKDAINA